MQIGIGVCFLSISAVFISPISIPCKILKTTKTLNIGYKFRTIGV